jgi:hypothetical protein
MDLLPPSKPGDRIVRGRPASSVLLKPIVSSGPEVVKSSGSTAILPSIRSSGKDKISHVDSSGRETIKSLPMLAGTAPKEKKRGRPTKAEKMREKRSRASEGIKALVDDDPSKADVHAYFEARIKELLDEV